MLMALRHTCQGIRLTALGGGRMRNTCHVSEGSAGGLCILGGAAGQVNKKQDGTCRGHAAHAMQRPAIELALHRHMHGPSEERAS